MCQWDGKIAKAVNCQQTCYLPLLEQFLNQAHVRHRLASAWFLKIDPVQIVGMCVCPRLRLLITSGVIWTSYDWLNKFYSCYMATVVVIVNGHGLGIGTRRRH